MVDAVLGRIFRPLVACCTNDKNVGPFLDAEEVLKIVKPTDLIEFRYKHCVHWGMYVGCDTVIHLCNTKRGNDGGMGKVTEDKLVKVAEGLKCRINNKEGKLGELSRLPGFIHGKRDSDVVIEEARNWIDPEEELKLNLDYDLISNNCEHVCMKWKYGVSRSEQVESAAKIVAGVGTAGIAAPIVGVAVDELVNEVGEAAKTAAENEADEEAEKAKAKIDEEKEKAKGMFKSLF